MLQVCMSSILQVPLSSQTFSPCDTQVVVMVTTTGNAPHCQQLYTDTVDALIRLRPLSNGVINYV